MSSEDSFLFQDVSECFQFPVKNLFGKTHWIKININESIKNLQNKIQEECEIPLEKQCFTCFDERTLSNGNDGMTETMNDIQAIRDDLKAINTAMDDVSLQPNNIDEYDQEHGFDGHGSFHQEELSEQNDEEIENRNENVATLNNLVGEDGEKDDTSDASDSTNENEKFDSNQSDEEETEVTENAEPSQSPSNSTSQQTNIIYKPNYRIENGFYRGQKILYIFDSDDESLCYTYTSLTGSKTDFVCRPCRSILRYFRRRCVFAEIIKKNGEECIKLNGNEHVCERQTIIDKSKFKLVEEKCGDRDIKHLYVFTSDDKSSYQNYTWQKNRYICYPCHDNHQLQVTAHVVENENGEEICFLSAQEHDDECQPRKCDPKKLTSGKRQRKTKK